ncbi:MoxR-like ATPase [Gammaproteobacteria bacterium]
MRLSDDTLKSIKRLQRIAAELKLRFAQRDTAVDLITLALACREHLLLLGPQGTGRSELVARFATAVQCEAFQYILTHLTDPTELFGPPDIEQFRQGCYHIRTEGMLPEARIAFLDEIFHAGSVVLNTLIALIQDRVFHNGVEHQTVPLISLFAASRRLPDDPTLRAFSDRFILRLTMAPIPDVSLGELLDKGWALELDQREPVADDSSLSHEQLDHLYHALPEVAVDTISPLYQDLLRHLRAEGIVFSDRRMVKGLKLVRAAALLGGRDQAGACDLWPLVHIWNEPEEEAILREVIQPLVEEAGGPTLEVHRSLEDLREDLELLASRIPDLRGDGIFTAHLAALSQLRRELTLHYPGAIELLARVEAEVGRVLEAMTPPQSFSRL